MSPTRAPLLVAISAVACGVAIFEIGSIILPSNTGAAALVGLLVAGLVAGIGSLLIARRILHPLRTLASELEMPRAPAIDAFLRSNVAEIAAVASAVQRTRSDLNRTMAQVQRDRSDMAALISHMADGVLVVDRHNRIELANPAASRLLRQTLLEGRQLVTAARDPEVLQVIQAARDGSPIRHAVELRHPDGHRCWVQLVTTQLPPDDRILVLLQDITEVRRAEAVRRDFVANVSHELKTPVASLKALVETLEAGALSDPECGPDFLRRMHVEVDGLAQLVAELLELARMEAARLDLDIVTCLADELVCEAAERIRPYASRVGLEVAVAETSGDARVYADPRQIGQVLSNLLSNAVKFTPAGGRIELGCRPDGEEVQIWVRDSGVGIARPDLVRVFERFFKADPSRTGSGTGLGLAISKHVVQAHHGSICAESDGPGRGTTVRFTLPAANSATAFTRSSSLVNATVG